MKHDIRGKHLDVLEAICARMSVYAMRNRYELIFFNLGIPGIILKKRLIHLNDEYKLNISVEAVNEWEKIEDINEFKYDVSFFSIKNDGYYFMNQFMKDVNVINCLDSLKEILELSENLSEDIVKSDFNKWLNFEDFKELVKQRQ
jgi:hypothetical protein